jgi:hypothetical protein
MLGRRSRRHCYARFVVRCARHARGEHSPRSRMVVAIGPVSAITHEFGTNNSSCCALQFCDQTTGSTTAMRKDSGTSSRRTTRRISAAFRAAVAGMRASSRSTLVRPGANGSRRWSLLTSRLSILCALGCAMALSGCAASDPTSASAASGPQMCRPDHALLTPQPAPDCGFGRADLKTLDPDQWARLKLEYELKCYKEAEKTARRRLQQLQAATKCEAPPAR